MTFPENRMNQYFSTRFAHDSRRDRTWKIICGYLQRFIPPHSRLLDLGAGYCSFVNHINAQEKHALDVWPEFTKFTHPGIHTHVMPCEDLSVFASGYFDVVFASNLLEHLPLHSVKKTILEPHRVLKPLGILVLVQPNFRYCYRQYFDDYTHVTIFTDVGLADLLSSYNFSIEKVEPRFLPLSFRSCLPKWPWVVRLYLTMPFRPFARQMLIVSRAVPHEISKVDGQKR